jgi:rRNA-processing protein FCF1
LKEVGNKSAISFHFEHGVFLREEDRQHLDVSIGDPVEAFAVKEDTYDYEICRDFDEINPESEAKKILALFEDIVDNHFTFLVRHGLMKQKNQVLKSTDPLVELYPELNVKVDSPFAHLFNKVSEVITDLVLSYPESNPKVPLKIKTSLKKKINSLVNEISSGLETYYKQADCVIGVGVHISNQFCQKPIEFAFGISALDNGITSRITGDALVTVNPFLLNWTINELAKSRNNGLVWNTVEYKIEKPNPAVSPIIPIKNLKLKCYVPSQDLIETGVTHEIVEKFLCTYLMSNKPFITNFDFLLPFTCPSITLEVKGPEVQTFVENFTFYGKILRVPNYIFRVNEATNFDLEFFTFPRFNKKIPVILDTSSLDISRLPLTSPFGSFFEAYLNQRVLIIPRTALHEIKTRLRTQDGVKVQKALVRLNKMLTWGLLKEIKLDGQFSIVSTAEKKDIEDLRDCIILDTAKRRNGILFTNDKELIKLANLMGIYTITFSGLEEDVLTVIRENNLKFTIDEAIKQVQEYGQVERIEDYSVLDIKWMITDLMKQNRLCTQRLQNKEVLEYLRPRLKNS